MKRIYDMKKQINDLLLKMQNGEICIGETANQLLDLFALSSSLPFNETQNPALRKTAVICCGVLERMELGWMKLEDGTKCMPYIKGHSDENIYRVNNCPSCGKHVRDVMIEP